MIVIILMKLKGLKYLIKKIFKINFSLKSFLQQLNLLSCRWNFSFQHIERLNNDIQTLLENDKNDEKIQERRQLTTIEVEKKKNNKALPPHKTSSLLFQPSNEFVEQIFKV